VASAQYYRMLQAYKAKINRKSDKIAGLFIFFAKWIRRRRFQIFRNVGPNFRTNILLKKADPEMFSFWVNNIFAEKQVFFDICGQMQSQKSSYQSD